MNICYDKDCDLSIVQARKIPIVGCGWKEHARANNLKDTGVDVTVGLRAGSLSVARAEAAGLKIAGPAEAVSQADVVMLLVPDEIQSDL